MTPNQKRWATVSGAIAGGIAASACCVLPLIFIWVGISGAWIANLTAMAAYHTWFIAFAFSLLALSYYFIFVKPKKECKEDQLCSQPLSKKWVKGCFWLAAVMILIATIFPYFVNYLYGAE